MPRPIKLTNTLTRAKEDFTPLSANSVGVYACGPTVYSFPHIGNMRGAFCWDVLTKALRRLGYTVKYVANVTDVGHLSSDGDEGEDKMILAMRKEGKSVEQIARFYEEAYFKDCADLNMARPDVAPRATEHVAEMIEMVQKLEANGFTYEAEGNIYFDTSKFPDYGKLAGGKRVASEEFSRVGANSAKRNPADFVLWFVASKFKDHAMKWPSPWGEGYPGWHIECSAMATKYLGERIDIHAGGQEHIAGHHSNEIAQSEGALGMAKPGESTCACGCADSRWVNYWLHNEWLTNADGTKMSKSKGTLYLLQDLVKLGFNPLALRLLFLGAHYRTPMAFSLDVLKSSQSAYDSLCEKLQEWSDVAPAAELSEASLALVERFDAALADDLNTPVALAVMWEVVKDGSLDVAQKKALLANFDGVLGLNLAGVSKGELTDAQQALLDERAAARAAKDWARSDEIRDTLAAEGIIIKDSKEGQTWTRK